MSCYTDLMIKFLLITILAYALASLYLFIKQRDLMYFPTPEENHPDEEVWWLETDQQKLKIWVLKNSSKENSPAIIYFGGNAETVENNIDDYRRMFAGYTVYITNYRGFGGSTGTPTEKNLFADALTIYDQVKAQHSRIQIIGRSLGSGIACYVAAHRPVEKLALITPYDSISNVAQSAYPLFPVKWLLKDHYDSMSYAPDIESDILIQIVNDDLVVTNKGSEIIAKALSHNKLKIERYYGVTHAGVSDLSHFQNDLATFFSEE